MIIATIYYMSFNFLLNIYFILLHIFVKLRILSNIYNIPLPYYLYDFEYTKSYNTHIDTHNNIHLWRPSTCIILYFLLILFTSSSPLQPSQRTFPHNPVLIRVGIIYNAMRLTIIIIINFGRQKRKKK